MTATQQRKFLVLCALCDGEMEFEIPAEVDDPAMFDTCLRVAKTGKWMHDACKEKYRTDGIKADRAAKMEARSRKWVAICPPLYQSTDFDRLLREKRTESVQEVFSWQRNPIGLVLHGSTGSGKSRSVYGLLARLFNEGLSIDAMTHQEFVNTALALKFDRDKYLLPRWMKLMKEVDVLLIDDLGKQKFTNADGEGGEGEQALFGVFESRCISELPTFFTTENNGAKLLQKFSAERGPGFVRRLRELCKPIRFSGDNHEQNL